jgi:N-methylhydantoinase A
MLKMLRIVSVEQGYDPQDFCLIPSGGSGPVHAVELAEELGIREVIVPPAPGLLSSQGLLSADVRYDLRRTFVASVADADLAALNALTAELKAEGARSLAEYQLPADRTEVIVTADMRYLGQAYEINVPLPGGALTDASRAALVEEFHRLHERIYGRRHVQGRVQFVNIVLTVLGRVHAIEHPELAAGKGMPRPVSRARTWFRGQPFDDCPCYERDSLLAGHAWSGPSVIAGRDSTVVIPNGWNASCDRFGNILMTRDEVRA